MRNLVRFTACKGDVGITSVLRRCDRAGRLRGLNLVKACEILQSGLYEVAQCDLVHSVQGLDIPTAFAAFVWAETGCDVGEIRVAGQDMDRYVPAADIEVGCEEIAGATAVVLIVVFTVADHFAPKAGRPAGDIAENGVDARGFGAFLGVGEDV
mgnify:CR=1 FL=1